MIRPDSVPLARDGKGQAGLWWRLVVCKHNLIPSYLSPWAFLLEFKLLETFICF